jgi:DNA-binding Lrp family transcriptional regulator
VRALEEAGVIQSYRAHVDATAMGLNFSAIDFATLRVGDRETVHAFEAAASAIPEIIQAQRLFGEPDYMLHVVSRDLPAFQKLYDDRLSAMPGVQRLTSTLVMKSVVQNRPLPLR